MPVDTISVRPSSEKTTKEVRIETQRTRGVTPSWELWETAGGKLARSYLAADGTLHLQTNDGVGGGWVDIPYDNTNMLPFFDGQFLQITDVDVVEDTGAVKLQIQKNGGGDLQIAFSSVWYTLDCTPVAEMTLTAGTDIAPQLNYVYITESGGVLTLTKSTSGWPDGTAFAAVATVVVQSAASLAIDGPMKLQVWTDHVESNGINGHLSHITRRLRYSPALWEDGVVPADMAVVDPNAYLSVSSGEAFQLHRLTFPALDMATGDPVFVVNDPTTAYKRITTLDDVTQDSSGGGINNKYLNLVLWGIINQNESECKLMLNLPSGTYTSEASAISDDENKADYTIPSDFTGTGFLIARYTVRAKDSGAWTQSAKADLRGLTPSSSPGGAGASSGNVIGPASATDNAVVRYDGATGKLLQDSGVLLDDSGALTVPDQTADPATPAAGFSTIWVSDGTGSGAAGDVMSIDSAGAVDNLTAASAVASPVTLTAGVAGETPLTLVGHVSQTADVLVVDATSLVVAANGNVGINKAVPAEKLHVDGDVIFGAGTNISPDSSGNGQVEVVGAGYGGFIAMDGTAMHVGHNSSSRGLHLQTNETSRIEIDGAGAVTVKKASTFEDDATFTNRVAIGNVLYTDIVNNMVSIESNASSTGMSGLKVTNNALTGTVGAAISHIPGLWAGLYGAKGSGGSAALYTDGEVNLMNGNVGIGTTTPSHLLDIEGSGNYTAAGAARMDIRNSVSGDTYFFHVGDSGDFQIGTGSTTKIHIAGPSTTAAMTFYGGAVFNQSGLDNDFRVESLNNANMLFVDGGNDTVCVGTNTAVGTLTVNGTMSVGTGHTLSGTTASIAGGTSNVVSGDGSHVGGGHFNAASGIDSCVPGGLSNTAATHYSTAIGTEAVTRNKGELTQSAGSFSTAGDSQVRRLHLRRQTTDATPVILSDDNAHDNAGSWNCAYKTLQHYKVTVLGHRTDDSEFASFTMEGTVRRADGSHPTSLHHSIESWVQSSAAWDSYVTVGSGGIKLYVVGEASKNINWSASVELVESTVS